MQSCSTQKTIHKKIRVTAERIRDKMTGLINVKMNAIKRPAATEKRTVMAKEV